MVKNQLVLIVSICLLTTSIFVSNVYSDGSPLSIRDVIQHALENNLQLKVDRISKDIQKENYNAVSTIFDPKVKAEASVGSTSSKTERDTFRSDIEKLDASVSKLIENGDTLLVSLASKRQKTNPYLPGVIGTQTNISHNLAISYKKPLMKGKGKDVVTTEIQMEKNNLMSEILRLEQKMIDTITLAQVYYWELYKSKEQLIAKIKSLELAREFLKTTQEKLDMGLIANNELLQAQAEVASREEAVIIAENTVKNNQDLLVLYTYGKIQVKEDSLVLTQKPLFEKLKMIQTETQIQKAMDFRIDYQIAKFVLENAMISYQYYKNQSLPKVDLNLILSINGDGKSNNVANDQFFSGDNYSGQIGISFEYPWKLRRDKANLAKAMHKKNQAELSLEKIKQSIVLDVRKTLRNVLSLEKRFASTKVAQNLAEEKLKMELDRFQSGYSTSYNVLQFQRDYTDAMVKNINASVDYQIARVNLEQSTGVTLDVHQIEVQ